MARDCRAVRDAGLLEMRRTSAAIVSATGEWRNWQTRRIQVPVSARTWGFKSPIAHLEVPGQLGCVEPGRPDFYRTSIGVSRAHLRRGRASQTAGGSRSGLPFPGRPQVVLSVRIGEEAAVRRPDLDIAYRTL